MYYYYLFGALIEVRGVFIYIHKGYKIALKSGGSLSPVALPYSPQSYITLQGLRHGERAGSEWILDTVRLYHLDVYLIVPKIA